MIYYVIKDMTTGRLLTGTGGQGGGSTLFRGGDKTPPKLYTKSSAKSVVTQLTNARNKYIKKELRWDPSFVPQYLDLQIIPVTLQVDISAYSRG